MHDAAALRRIVLDEVEHLECGRSVHAAAPGCQHATQWSGRMGRSSGQMDAAHAVGACAARREGAALGQLPQRRDPAGDLMQPGPRLAGLVDARHGREQAERVGMLGLGEQLVHRRLLRLAPGVHDHDPVGDVRHHAEVVRDQDDRRPELVAHVGEQVEDAGLDRHVERGRRLVGDQHLRLAGERDRDHDALTHAAGELVRIGVEPLLRRGDVHQPQQLDRPVARLTARQAEALRQHLADLRADREHRVERGERFLEDVGHVVRAHAAQLSLRERQQVDAAELRPAG